MRPLWTRIWKPSGKRAHTMLRFANTAAYLVTTKKGAPRSMPERAQVEALIK